MVNTWTAESFGALADKAQIYKRDVSANVITGHDPTTFDPSHPITLFIIQLFIIISFTQGLAWAFGFIRQPKVIAEVIGGIILGPTVMGRAGDFTEKIFPEASISYLNLIANIGLVLFLFLIGLEVDIGVMKKNGRNSAIISVVGMVVPFGLGAAVAVPIYHEFVDSNTTEFGHFVLFVGVAIAITAFPVLCRILTSTKLLDTRVGVIVLAAGVGNDVVGWVLLALTLALVNADRGETAVYVLLCAVGWTVIMLWPIKKGFRWLARRTGSLDHGPTPGMMVVTLLIVFASAFVTGIIGVHPIFGGFIAGLIVPHDGGFAVALVEKLEDLITMLFIPIYFVLSGLSTNLGLLDRGKDWGYLVLLCVVAWAGKFIGCGGAAWCLGYTKRESGAIGMLMSCKGLVELIVLNVGLSAGIIDQRLFSIFVVVCLVLTFITTPFTLWFYPEKHRLRAHYADGKAGTDIEHSRPVGGGTHLNGGSGGREITTRLLVVLQKIEHLSAVMMITQMLEPATTKARTPKSLADHRTSGKRHSIDDGDLSLKSVPSHPPALQPETATRETPAGPIVQIDALKLTELTGRTFSVMQSAEKDQLLLTDSTLQVYRQFGQLRGLEITPHISVIETNSYPTAVADHANDLGSELVVVPWTVPVTGSSSALIDPSPAAGQEGITASSSAALSPFENIFGAEHTGSPMYTHFLRRAFTECPSDIALFVDRGFGSSASIAPGAGQHVYLPFFGGPDDRLALRLVVQLCQHQNVTATIIRFIKTDSASETSSDNGSKAEKVLSDSEQAHHAALQSNQLTIGPHAVPNTVNRIASETADDIAWSYYTTASTSPPRSAAIDAALSRINLYTSKTTTPLLKAFAAAETTASDASQYRSWRSLLIALGRGRRGATTSLDAEVTSFLTDRSLNPSVGAELRKTVGDVGTAMMLGGGAPSSATFLICEAAK